MDIKCLQSIVKDRYYGTDSKRNIFHTFAWFIEEVGELSSAIASHDHNNIEEELGDVLMWLLTIANLHDIDMDIVVNQYLTNASKERPKK